MDLVKLTSVTASDTSLTQGSAINGWDSVLWVERFQEPGEFKISAKLSSGLTSFLPLNCFITHTDTNEIMMVENYEIHQPEDEDPTVDITGRSFMAYLENRIVGDWYAAALNRDIPEYIIGSNPSWEQAVDLINQHVVTGFTFDANDTLTDVFAYHSCFGSPVEVERDIKYGPVLTRVEELLKIDNTGLRTRRPTSTDIFIYYEVYQGTDRTNTVHFSWTAGDLSNLEYLYSAKAIKTRARVMGRWVQVITGSGPDNYDRRTIVVDASDIDQKLTAMPTGTPLTNIVNKMTIRGNEVLAKQKNVTIVQADVKTDARWVYRKDYNLGDLVTVDGDFGSSAVMQVTEFAEVVDEDGASGHPTLSIPGA